MSRRLALEMVAASALSAGVAGLVAWFLSAGPREWMYGADRYTLDAPVALYALAVLPLLALALRPSLADLPPWQRAVSYALRAALVTLLALALAEPSRTMVSTKTSTIFLVDVSESVSDAALADFRAIVDATWRARGEHDVQLVTFARHPRVVPLDTNAEAIPALPRPSTNTSNTRDPGAGTNLEAALQLAYGLFPAGHLRRVVILSDGVQTEGDALGEASRAKRFGVRVSSHPSRRGAPAEVAVRDLALPDKLEVGATFFVRGRLFATQPTRVRVCLRQDDGPNALDPQRELELPRGETDIAFRSIVRVPGPVTYTVEVEPLGADRFRANNRFVTSAIVPGRPTVMLVDSDPSRATWLARALSVGDYEVDVRSARELPTTVRELERFDFVVLSDVPADAVSLGQMDALERYVRDLGGGFLMAGGEQGFGLGGWGGTRIEQLLPVRMDAERRRDQPSLALALVIDKSGSMTGLKMELAKEAARATAELLSGEDYLEVVGFDAQPVRIVRMQSAANRLRILTDIGRLAPSGGTAIFPALDMAYQDLAVTRARIKHVILLTDGQTQESGLDTLVQAMRAESITVSIVGLGGDVNRALLQSLANLGGGRAYFTVDPHNVPRIFTRETTTVARSSAVEEYFQPIVASPADFLRSVDLGGAPFLHGYVATQAKPAPAQVVLRSELGEPLLARWRVGLGWALAWTSDVKNRWAVDWLRWPGFQPFWARLVREHMRQRRRETLDMRASLEDGVVHVEVDAVGDDDRFLDGLESRVTMTGPLGTPVRRTPSTQTASTPPAPTQDEARRTETHTLRQTAPGRYEARFPLDRYGAFTLEAVHTRDGRPVAESRAQLANPYPSEYANVTPSDALLRDLADLTGGDREPSPARLFAARGESIRHVKGTWAPLLHAALALFVLDLLARRVRFFDAAARRRARTRRGS
jgi:Ca-activated chloride channel family protein